MSLASSLRAGLLAAAALTVVAATAQAQTPAPTAAQTAAMTPDIDDKYVAPKVGYDYDKRVIMVPMRDGTKLYTVIVVPKGGKSLPIMLTRTPYNAAKRAARATTARGCWRPCPRATSPSWPTAAISACSRTCAASTARKATM